MPWNALSLLACLASTWYMTGLIWFVQVVHYPLFDRVGSESFPEYHAAHVRRTTWVVLGPMLVELGTSLALVVARPPGVSARLAWFGLLLAALTWLSTILWQVPLHDRLAHGFDAPAQRRLVISNAARAIAWTAHALLVLVMTARALQ